MPMTSEWVMSAMLFHHRVTPNEPLWRPPPEMWVPNCQAVDNTHNCRKCQGTNSIYVFWSYHYAWREMLSWLAKSLCSTESDPAAKFLCSCCMTTLSLKAVFLYVNMSLWGTAGMTQLVTSEWGFNGWSKRRESIKRGYIRTTGGVKVHCLVFI